MDRGREPNPDVRQRGCPPDRGRQAHRPAPRAIRPFEESAMTQRKNKSARKPRLEKKNNEEPSDARKDKPVRSLIQPRAYPDPIDDTLDDSFPASDPPSWAGR